MVRILLAPLLALLLVLSSATATAQPVRGLIVKLKTPDASVPRESPQALRERIAAVASDAVLAPQRIDKVGEGGHLMRFSGGLKGEALDAALRRLRLHPDVAWVEPDVMMKRLAVPNDPFYASLQWYLQPRAIEPAGISAPAAWDTTTGSNLVVAVLDTGVRFSHPDLRGKLLPGYDFISEAEFANDGDGRDADPSDPGDWVSMAESRTPLFSGCDAEDSSWHGTFISAQIAGLTNNGVGVAGVNWGGRILPVRVSGKCGAFLSDILDAIRWSAGLAVDGVPTNPNPARIINLSFGGDLPCTSSYQDVIDAITAAGSLMVVAAGNESGALRRPADCRGVLTVGSLQRNNLRASYSNFGSNLALMAPGGSAGSANDIYSAVNLGTTSPGADDYGYKRGTSFSAPLASGVAALMLTLNPVLTPAQIIARMRAGARAAVNVGSAPSCGTNSSVACNCTAATCGAGLLDAEGAIAQALVPVAIIQPVSVPVAGATITLDGRSSAAALGSSLTAYRWTQVSGPAVTIQNASASQAQVALPSAVGSFVFKLAVTDAAGRVGEELAAVTSTSGTSSGGSGGGALSLLWGVGLWMLALLALFARRRGGL